MRHFADLLLKKNNSKINDQVPFIQRRRGIEIKSAREINLMKKSSRIVATVLREINDLIKPGMSTKDLDDFAEKRIRSFGAVPSFKGYHGFPSSICSSINNEVVHGIPNKNNSKTNDQVPFIQRRRGIEIKSAREINLMKKSSRIVATVLKEINDLIKPGMSTKDLLGYSRDQVHWLMSLHEGEWLGDNGELIYVILNSLGVLWLSLIHI